MHWYVDLESDRWVIGGDSQWKDGDFVVRVKPRLKRQTATGTLVRGNGSKAGFCVFWRGPGEQEGHIDFITATTARDGNFTAAVLPGKAYGVFINDTHNVSNMVDLIPAPTDGFLQPTATLQLQEPETIELLVTAGPQQRPLVNQSIYVRQDHDYQWDDNGKQRSRSASRDRYVYTDEKGKAFAVVESGKKARVTIYSPDSVSYTHLTLPTKA